MTPSTQFSELLSQIRLSEPTLSFDEAWQKAVSHSAISVHNVVEEGLSDTFRMDDPTDAAARILGLKPGYDASAMPTEMKAKLLAEYQALDRGLIASSVKNAVETSVERMPRAVPPPAGGKFRAALDFIANSNPPMAQADAMALAERAFAEDQADLNARYAATVQPKINTYKEPLVRG